MNQKAEWPVRKISLKVNEYWPLILVLVILIHWIAIYPVDSAFQRLNNRGLFYCTDSAYSIDAISFIFSVNFTSAWTYARAEWHYCLYSRYQLSSTRWKTSRRFVRHIAFEMFAWGLGQSGLWLVRGLVLMLVVMSIPFSLVKATT